MNRLVVIVGPTGVGKTELSLQLAERLHAPIVSCDSRQIYREIPIGTAAATEEDMRRVPHYFVGCKSVGETYNAGQYERDALALLDELFREHDYVVMVGGSMMYVDAVCKGLDDIPAVPDAIREEIVSHYREAGMEWLQQEVKRLDPKYWEEVDRANPQRLIHCLEVTRHSGVPYSSFRRNASQPRPFEVVKIGLDRPRKELYERINKRVEKMMELGLLDEVKRMLPYRSYNSLNTVGYKELFQYLDGACTLEDAVATIQKNTRHYAKRQLTWFRADGTTHWFNAEEATVDDLMSIVK